MPFVLVLLAVVLQSFSLVAYAGDGDVDSLVVRYRGAVEAADPRALPAERAQRVVAALPAGFAVTGRTRGGAFVLQLDRPLSVDAARMALNQLRADPDLLYADVVKDEANARPRALKRASAGPPVEGLIVKYRAAKAGSTADAALADERLARIAALAGQPVAQHRKLAVGASVVRFMKPVTPDEADAMAALLEADPAVLYAHADRRLYPTMTPNDSLYPLQWSYMSPATEPGGVNLPAAWDLTTGSTAINIAVIDTGIVAHPELAGRTAGGYDFISNTFISSDGDERDPNPADPGDWTYPTECGVGWPGSSSTWHGTHVAGTIAAASNNGSGVAGVNWVSKVVPLRALGTCGGFISDITDAIVWAVNGPVPFLPVNPFPARVINLSLGGSSPCDSALQDAIDTANEAGAVVVVAAGNENDSAATSEPANCNGVITVAATQRQGYRAEYSNFGAAVDIAAPGGGSAFPSGIPAGVLSTLNTGTTLPGSPTYASYEGTSMATPHVAGIASLMLSVNPTLTPSQVLAKLQGTARTFRTGAPACAPAPPAANPASWFTCTCTTALCGAGIVDAFGAVQAALGSIPTVPGNVSVFSNPYGPLLVQGATVVGSTISNLQPNAVIQLGSVAGNGATYTELDFHGFNLGAGNTLTIRSGAAGQTVRVVNVDFAPSVIAGSLQIQGGNGAPAPVLYLKDPNGFTLASGASIVAPSGMTVDALGSMALSGARILNQGLIDGGSKLQLAAARINGGGAFKGNAVTLATFGSANNPVNGARFLANSLQVHPSSGNAVALTLNGYGSVPQVFNVMINGNGTASMPSSWPAGAAALANAAPVLQGATRVPGAPDPAFGGGSLIVQATGTLSLVGGSSNDFAFPGSIVLKAGTTLDTNGVAIDNGWTTSGQSFQGVFLEAPTILSSGATMPILTNNFNWINFSTLPGSRVQAFQLVRASDGSAGFVNANAVAPHLNTYSTLIEAAAAGQCYVCLINSAPINVQ